MCGGTLNITDGVSIAECEYCGSVQTLPKFDDDLKIKMFERANELRERCEFDQAATLFQSIVMQFPEEAEAYWGLVLCKYGIEYVDDFKMQKKIPTCHRTQAKSIITDKDYLAACEYAGVAKWVYEKEAEDINRIQKKILDIVHTEEPYDIFICYKETDDETKSRTEDSSTAQDIYTELIKEGYRVFYSRISLRDKAGSEYEPYIYAALSSAKIMIVLGSKSEYFNAVWLKNEWSRYLNMMEEDNKTLIPCFEKISVGDLPKELRNFEALDMSSKLFFTDLLKNIKRLLSKNNARSEPINKINERKNIPKNDAIKPIIKEEKPLPPKPIVPPPVNQGTLKNFKLKGNEDIDDAQLKEVKMEERKEKMRDIAIACFFIIPVIFMLYYFLSNKL